MYHTAIPIATSISSVGTHQWADLVYNRADEPVARGKISLACGIHYSNFLNFFYPLSVSILSIRCVCIHISEWVEIVYELLLLSNNNASETFLTNWE